MKRRGLNAKILTSRKGIIIAILAIVGIGTLGLQTSWASDNNTFPELSIASTWDLGNKTPGDGLFQTYARNGGADGDSNGNFNHVLKNENSSQVRNTKVRAYFTSYPSGPITVDVSQLDNACNFTGPSDQRITMTIGDAAASKGGNVGPAYSGKAYSDTMQVQKTYYQFWKYDGNGNRTYRSNFDTTLNGQSNPFIEACETSQDVIDNVRLNEICGTKNAQNECRGADTDDDGYGDGAGTIRADCGDAPGGNDLGQYCMAANQPDDTRNPTYNNKFQGNFTADPSDGSIIEVVRGKVWAVDINVNLAGSIHTGNQNQVRFKLSVNGSWRMGFPDFTQSGNAAQSFGVSARGGFEDTTRGIRTMIPFGLPCNSPQPFVERTLSVYDVDKTEFGNIYVSVFARNPDTNDVIRLGEIPSSNNAVPGGITGYNNKLTFNSAQMRLQATDLAQNDSVATFNLKMHKGYQYMFVLVNPNQVPASGGPPKNPMNNLLSLGIPESIYGIVNCNYTLTPSVDDIAPAFSYDADFTEVGRVNVNGDDTEGHDWQLTKLEYTSEPDKSSAINTSTPCTFRPSGCEVLASGSVPSGFGGNFATAPTQYTKSNVPVGTRICFMMSVRKPTLRSGAGEWSHSSLKCSVSSIKPKIQVWGGDTKAGSIINTSLTRIDATYYGSWGEYGVASNGRNVGMASGSGLIGGDSNNQSDWSKLTFSNENPFVLGNFGGVLPLSYTPPAATQASCADLGTATYRANDKVIIQCAGTLRITGNQTFDAAYASIGEIPNVKIVADNIIIGEDVTRIDPWLIARNSSGVFGRITTCGQVGSFGDLNSDVCSKPIKFNGPVIANNLYLFRTHDEKTGDTAAETFNLRADNILSSYVGSGVDRPVARTELITELPPRF